MDRPFRPIGAVTLHSAIRLSTAQYYYMSVLSVLFIHCALDGYFFLVGAREERDLGRMPLALPSKS